MMHRRNLLLVAAMIAAAAVITSTGGVSSIAADRGVQVEVAADQHAYLGFEQTATDTENGTTNLSVTVSNQFPPDTSLTAVTVTINDMTVDLAESDSLATGDSATAVFRAVFCDDTITIEASGDGVSVTLVRSVDCTE